MDDKKLLDKVVDIQSDIDKEAHSMAVSGDIKTAKKHRQASIKMLSGLLSKLTAAKSMIKKGDVESVLDTLRSTLNVLSDNAGKCKECGSIAAVVHKGEMEQGQCSGCGALWSKKIISDNLLKYEQEEKIMGDEKKYTKKELIQKMWDMWTKGDKDITAFDVNQFEAKGCLRKSIVEKLGIMPPDCAAAREEIKKEFVDVVKDNALSKSDVLDIFLQMIKKGEETQRVNRHTLAKFEATGQIDEDVMDIIYKKAGKDYFSLKKELADNAPLRHKVRAKEGKPKLDRDSKEKLFVYPKKDQKMEVKKEKGDSDFLDDKKEHQHQKRGPLKQLVFKKKK